MKKLLLLLALIFNSVSWSQEYSPEFTVSRTDLSNVAYSKDTTANALVIYDYGNSFINKETFWLNVEIKRKIKILSIDGYDRANVEIPIYVGKTPHETITEIEAKTFNIENGKLVATEIEKNAIFEEKNNQFNIIKFTLPNVKVGSVIAYSYKKSTRYITKFHPWYFQEKDPVLYSEYNTSIPGNYEYNVKLVGGIPLDVNENDIKYDCLDGGRGGYANCSVSKYVMKNIPAYKEEDFTTTSEDHIARIEYELKVINGFDGSVEKLTKSWRDVDSELKSDTDFGRRLGRNNIVKDVLPQSIVSINSPLEKAKAIYQFVIDNYRWNDKSGRYDVDIKKLIEEKGGSVFELNIFLENLLTSENIEVYPILMSTRGNGLVTKLYPVLSEYNYLILKATIADKDYYLDATSPYLGFGELPFRCLNQYGRLFDFDNESRWEDIIIGDYSVFQVTSQLFLNEDNQIEGIVRNKLSGYSSYSKKRNYDENKQTYLERLKSNYNFSTIKNHNVLNEHINSKFFEEEMDVVKEDAFVGDKIFFNPFLFRFFEENPFKLQERTYPIDFGYKQLYSYILEFDLKDKLIVEELPESINISLPNKKGSFIFNIQEENNVIKVYMRLRFNEPIYNSEYYPYLKEFMNKVIETQNNKVIVLKRLER